MLKLEEIKSDLRRGDQRVIHEMTKIPADTIESILLGRRNDQTERGQTVLKAAQKVIAARKMLLEPILPEPVQKKSQKVPKAAKQLDIFSAKQ